LPADVVLSTTCDKDDTTGDSKNRQFSIPKLKIRPDDAPAEIA
jgi:hypothetical protein